MAKKSTTSRRRHALAAGPEMMAIGDSVYNGVRGLAIGPDYARYAPPVLIAQAFDWDFVAPDYPRDVVFNLDDVARREVEPGDILRRIKSNLRAWIGTGGPGSPLPNWSDIETFDNLAISGFRIGHLWRRAPMDDIYWRSTYDGAVNRIRPSADRILAADNDFDLLSLMGEIVTLYFALNTCFVLNPTHNPTLAGRTVLDAVAARKPRRLLINIGANNGLGDILLSGRLRVPGPDGDFLGRMQDIRQEIVLLAERLAALPRQTEVVVFNLLPRPKVVANLYPRMDGEMPDKPGGYFKNYVARWGMLGGITGTEMAALDDSVYDAGPGVGVNEAVQKIITDIFSEHAPQKKLVFADLFAAFSIQDHKHGQDPRPVAVRKANGDIKRLGNMPFGGVRRDGLFSLDNFHPSAVGYALLAEAVATAIHDQGLGDFDPRPFDPQRAYNADRFLNSPPRFTDELNFVVSAFLPIVSAFAKK